MRDLPRRFHRAMYGVLRDRISVVLNSWTMQGYERNKKGPTLRARRAKFDLIEHAPKQSTPEPEECNAESPSSVLQQAAQDDEHSQGEQNPDLENDEPHLCLASPGKRGSPPLGILSGKEPMDGR